MSARELQIRYLTFSALTALNVNRFYTPYLHYPLEI